MDGGTLFQLRNLTNRRNVRKDPTDNVNACEDFFLIVTEGHILAATMQVFGMTSLDCKPCNTYFPEGSSELDPLQRREVLLQAVNKVVTKFVDVTLPRQEEQGTTSTTREAIDSVHEYAKDILSLGLLYLEFTDAIREGDGSRILRCWHYLLLIF